jgi:hypothetical protein
MFPCAVSTQGLISWLVSREIHRQMMLRVVNQAALVNRRTEGSWQETGEHGWNT